MARDVIEAYGRRVGYSEDELKQFRQGQHCVRQVQRLARASALYSIEAEVVAARHCNSGHAPGQKFVLDVDGNFITKRCPSRMCVYLISQLTIPVALINERLSEGLPPNDFHFMHQLRCLDVGVECQGYGEVSMRVQVVPRVR